MGQAIEIVVNSHGHHGAKKEDLSAEKKEHGDEQGASTDTPHESNVVDLTASITSNGSTGSEVAATKIYRLLPLKSKPWK